MQQSIPPIALLILLPAHRTQLLPIYTPSRKIQFVAAHSAGDRDAGDARGHKSLRLTSLPTPLFPVVLFFWREAATKVLDRLFELIRIKCQNRQFPPEPSQF